MMNSAICLARKAGEKDWIVFSGTPAAILRRSGFDEVIDTEEISSYFPYAFRELDVFAAAEQCRWLQENASGEYITFRNLDVHKFLLADDTDAALFRLMFDGDGS